MKAVSEIHRHGNTTAQFKEQAKALRELADEAEKGNLLAVKWVVISKESDKVIWRSEHYKAKGISAMELYGTLMLAAAEYAQEYLQESPI